MDILQTPNSPAAIGPYSQAVKAGNTVYCSGQIPLDKDGNMVAGDIVAQTEQVLANLSAVLEAAGASLADVAKTTVYLADMTDFPAMNEVYAKAFGDHTPARATVAVKTLPKNVSVEIDAIAVVR